MAERRVKARRSGAILAGDVGGTKTNLGLYEADRLAARLGLASVALLNDLEATAWALDALGPDGTAVLLEGAPGAPGNQGIVAAGTGLGEAMRLRDGGRSIPVASEAGHADFAPHTDLEIELLRYLRKRFGRVSEKAALLGAARRAAEDLG